MEKDRLIELLADDFDRRRKYALAIYQLSKNDNLDWMFRFLERQNASDLWNEIDTLWETVNFLEDDLLVEAFYSAFGQVFLDNLRKVTGVRWATEQFVLRPLYTLQPVRRKEDDEL